MLSQNWDLTATFNANNGVKVDVSEWQFVTIGIDGTVSGTVNILGTNNGGAIEGSGDGNAKSSLNYTAMQAINLATGAATTSISAAGLYRITVGSKYLQVGGAAAATTGKVYLFVSTH